MTVLSVRNFPDELMHKLKTAALAEKITLREYVIRHLEQPQATATKHK